MTDLKRARRPYALSTRLVAVATLWSVVALAMAGFILVALYRQASERSFDERLDVYVKAIVGGMARGDGDTLIDPGNLGEPRFELPLSGWYWTVRELDTDAVVYASASLVGDPLVLMKTSEPDIVISNETGPDGGAIRAAQRKISFGPGRDFNIAVAGATDELSDSITAFASQVAITLTVLGMGLVGAIVLQVRVGLRPLRTLHASLLAVRRGDAQAVDEALPREIEPLAVELNALIHSNKEVVERSRTHVGNLAHGLKTPLSVILNEARGQEGAFAQKVLEQSSMMRSQIDHHLERARMAAQRRVIGVSTQVQPVVVGLARAMEKIHREREPEIQVDAPEDLRFRGERQDLEELVGNLLDNACKWMNSTVAIKARSEKDKASSRGMLSILIYDDGPGLDEDQRRDAVKRGRRLDETVPGTGLGLSIVADLAALYGGRLELARSPLGGLAAKLYLPSV